MTSPLIKIKGTHLVLSKITAVEETHNGFIVGTEGPSLYNFVYLEPTERAYHLDRLLKALDAGKVTL